jgi:mycothiol S-conjugate amidase
VRRGELDASAALIGYDEVVLLGYRDSGMAGTEANSNPLAFANAPIEEVTGRLVREIRRTRPQVIITYDEDQSGYPHPDHLRVHDVSVAAFDAAGNGDLFPEAGDPFRPAKLYYSSWPWRQILALHHRLLELGLESPFSEFAERVGEPPEDTRTTTRIDIRGYEDVRTEALKAHATQIDPEGFWFNLPPEVTREFLAYDDFILARGTVGEDLPEDDLFAGLRAGVGAR